MKEQRIVCSDNNEDEKIEENKEKDEVYPDIGGLNIN